MSLSTSAEIALGHIQRSVSLATRDERSVGVLSVGVEATGAGAAQLFRELADRAHRSTRTSDLEVVYARDELLIVLTAMAHAGDAAIVAVRLLLDLSRPYELEGQQRTAKVSIGVASFPTDGVTAQTLVDSARAAMGRARSAGGGYAVAAST